jgi:prolyl oligopeptidase
VDDRSWTVSTRREDRVDTIFGRPVADPYRWLEAGDSEEVRRWTDQQNELTRRTLLAVPGREQIRARLAELLMIGTVGTPVVRRLRRDGASDRDLRYFHTRREGEQNQPVLYVRDGVHGTDRVLIDPNALASDGTTALDWWAPSNDGRLLIYGLSENGDENSTLRVRDVDAGHDIGHPISRTRFASIAWLPGGEGFYYTRYPEKGTVPEGEEGYHRTVYLHHIGRDAGSDPKIFEPRKMTDSPGVEISPDGRWLVLSVHQGWAKDELYLQDRSRGEAAPFVPMVTDVPAIFDALVLDDVIYIRTNDGAPRYRLYAVDPRRPERAAWREIVPEQEDVLAQVAVAGDEILTTYLCDASSRVRRFPRAGGPGAEIELPMLGSSSGVSALWDGDEAFFDFSSFALAPTVFRLDLRRGTLERWEAVRAPIDEQAFVVERLRATSRDGTVVPMFVVHKRGLARGSPSPTLLMGYGGFNVNMVPWFTRSTYLLLERGGILAVMNLRGGGEFGEDWHQGGMLDRKQNVFDDAIACAEKLVASGYTDPSRLAVQGGSNGGLLVGALLTQRPDLFRAVVCSVPLLDMLRYHLFRIAKLWIPEYGSADDPQQFEWLYAYSPYHHVREGVSYPAVLLTTAESDSRVDPLHARKMAAALQAATSSELPVLLRVETKAGHGAGKPVAKLLDELTDMYSFLFSQLSVSM